MEAPKDLDEDGENRTLSLWLTPVVGEAHLALKKPLNAYKGSERINMLTRQVSHDHNYKGHLNPRWVEALMGLPVGWCMPSCVNPWTISECFEVDRHQQTGAPEPARQDGTTLTMKQGIEDVDTPKELTHISLCAGYGGIDLGLGRALHHVRTIAFSEIESFVCQNLVSKMEKGFLHPAPIWTNLKTFPWERFRGNVDILSGGFPCQPFSSAGRRSGDEDPRHLFPYIKEGIRKTRPSIVFLENVEGILSAKLKGSDWSDPEGTPVLLHVLRELERLGYRTTASLFSASEIGAPHQRKRIFILAHRADLTPEDRGVIDGMLRATERGRELGNPQHNGHPSSEIRGGNEASSNTWGTQGEDSEREPERAGGAVQMLSHAPRGAEQELAYSESPRGERERGTMGEKAVKSKLKDGGAEPYCSSPTAYPAPRGAKQYPWEPPRVTMGNSKCGDKGSRGGITKAVSTESGDRETDQPTRTDHAPSERVQGEAEPAMGGDSNGASSRMVYAELCNALDNRTDELRLLGNGVVPATAERAFRVLWAELGDSSRFTARRNLRALFP